MAYPVGPGMLTFYGNQPVIVQQANTSKGFSDKSAKTTTILGALQIATGFLAAVFQAVATGLQTTSSRRFTAEVIGGGIWCGFMFMVAGLLGTLAGRKKTIRLTVASLAFNIIVSVLVWILVGLAASNMSNSDFCSYMSRSVVRQNTSYYESYQNGSEYTSRIRFLVYYDTVYDKDVSNCYGEAGRVWQAMDSLLILLAVFEFAIAITTAAYCCRALSCCCCQKSAQTILVVQHGVSGPAGSYQFGPSMQPTFLQQGYSVQVPVFANAMTLAGQVVNSTHGTPAQMRLPCIEEAMPSSHDSGSPDPNNDYTSPTASSPNEQMYSALTPDEPPDYVYIVAT